MNTLVSSSMVQPFFRPGFRWDGADAYLFDIDGTLLNSRDAVHYFAFQTAMRQVMGISQATIDNVPVHGNTDIGILRAALRQEGVSDDTINERLPAILTMMCDEVKRNQEQLRPELCASIRELILHLRRKGKLLGAASGNLETIGWLKLEKAGLKPFFSFGSFSNPREHRADIFRHGVTEARERLGESAQVFVVGDTPSDIAAAKEVGVPIIALATGIFSFHDLLTCDPEACAACGSDLLSS
jgi:phosphoglycolate phosphatase-like HAD superfamily hydrolase